MAIEFNNSVGTGVFIIRNWEKFTFLLDISSKSYEPRKFYPFKWVYNKGDSLEEGHLNICINEKGYIDESSTILGSESRFPKALGFYNDSSMFKVGKRILCQLYGNNLDYSFLGKIPDYECEYGRIVEIVEYE